MKHLFVATRTLVQRDAQGEVSHRRSRRIAYVHTYERAEEILLENEGDWVEGEDCFACIERVEIGNPFSLKNPWWYQATAYEDGTVLVEKIETPPFARQIVGYWQ